MILEQETSSKEVLNENDESEEYNEQEKEKGSKGKKRKPIIKVGKIVGLYNNLYEARQDLRRRGIYSVPVMNFRRNGQPRLIFRL